MKYKCFERVHGWTCSLPKKHSGEHKAYQKHILAPENELPRDYFNF